MRCLLVVMLVACGKSSEKSEPPKRPDPLAAIELAVITGGFEPARPPDNLVVVSPTSIALGDKPILALADGVADAAEREGGALGMKLPKLVQALAGTEAKWPLHVAIDKRVPYRTLYEVLYSAKQKEAGYTTFHILAKRSDTVVQAPIALPDKARPISDDDGGRRRPGADLARQIEDVKESGKTVTIGGGSRPRTPEPTPATDDEAPAFADKLTVEEPQAHPDDMPIKLIVTIAKGEVLLWSLTGLEGTLREPKLRAPLDGGAAAVRTALADVVARRWSADKPQRDQAIILQADPTTPMQRVVEMMAAVRASETGTPLFPDIMFSAGFE